MGRFQQAVIFALLAVLLHWAVDPGQNAQSACSLHAHNNTLLLFSRRVVTPSGTLSAVVEVRNGEIDAVTPADVAPEGALDFTDAVISPGLVDIHVHLNEPGRSEWEGFLTGTRAAAAGGVTTVVDMPLNSFPTTTMKETFTLKLAAARGKLFVDVAFWGGLVPGNANNESQLTALLDAGVVGLKAFMCPSGINDFENTNVSHFAAALPHLNARGALPLMVHAELVPEVVPPVPDGADPRLYETYMNTRPREWEENAIRALLEVATPKSRIHIAHLGDAQSVSLIKAAKAAGKAVTVETCPHYLLLAADDVAAGDTRFKCAPPLRHADNRGALVASLVHGDIDMVSSDHSPAPPSLKRLEDGNFLRAWGGIAGLQFGLAATWTAVRNAGGSIDNMSAWWSARPAQLVGLSRKGTIAPGKDADFVVWSPDTPVVTNDASTVFHKHKLHPYQGRQLYGAVLATFVRGHQVFDGALARHARAPCGKPLLRVPSPV